MLTHTTNETILSPGWQVCTKLNLPRDTNGTAVYLQGTADALGFFEAVAVSELERTWFKLPAPAQRHFFGANIFGNKSLWVSPDGQITVFWTTAFGRDFETVYLRYDQMQRAFVYSDGRPWNRKNV